MGLLSLLSASTNYLWVLKMSTVLIAIVAGTDHILGVVSDVGAIRVSMLIIRVHQVRVKLRVLD